MLTRLTRVAAVAAAGALTLATAGCGSGNGGGEAKDNKVGAMANYAVGQQFTATEPFELPILYSNNPIYTVKDDWLFWQELTKRTKVTLKRTDVPTSDYIQKRSLLIGSGQAPLLIPKTYPHQEDAFVASGAILPVSDYLDLMPNLKDKVAKWHLESDLDTLRQADGKFYLLPGLHQEVWPEYSIAMRTDVLKQVGQPVPTTWDQFRDALAAIKKAYPKSYPLSEVFNKGQEVPAGNLFSLVGTSFGTNAGWNYQDGVTFDQASKKFVLSGTTPEYKAMVTYLHQLYTQGLLDPESFTQDDDTGIQKLANSKSFALSANNQKLVIDFRPPLLKKSPKATLEKIKMPAGPAGDVKAGSRLENGIMLSSKLKESKNFVATMQFIDWLWYSDEGQEFAKWGVKGVTYDKDASGKRVLADGIDFLGLNPKGGSKDLRKDFGFGNGVFAYGGSTDLLQSTFSAEEIKFQKQMATKKTLPLAPPHPLTDVEREQATLWQTPVKDHVTSQTLRFVLGQRDLGQWDAYVAEVNAKGGKSWLELVNKAYERYQKDHG